MSASKYDPPYPAIPRPKISTKSILSQRMSQISKENNSKSKQDSSQKSKNYSNKNRSSHRNTTTLSHLDGTFPPIQAASMEEICQL